VAGRFREGVPAFVVTSALAVPLTILFARAFAAVFETPWLRAAGAHAAGLTSWQDRADGTRARHRWTLHAGG
jgi:hypothetical protein